jgi:hypothetical protein
MRIETGSGSNPGISLWDGATVQNKWIIGSGVITATDGKFAIYDERQSVHRLIIDTNGNIGIGTTTPEKKLHIAGAGDINPMIEATDNGFASLSFKSNNKTWQWSKRSSQGGDAMWLSYHDGSAWLAPSMAIGINGNVGIGTL